MGAAQESAPSLSYWDRANRYIDEVMAGDIPACRHVIKACTRQFNDLRDESLPYSFDVGRANHVCAFIELLPNIKGEWAGKPLELADWQCFILTTVFGWVDESGYRRYKTAYIEVPRKNGKSSLSSGVGLYMLAADDEPGAEVYASGVTRDQAKIVWEDAKRMVERCDGLRKAYGVEAMAHSITIQRQGSMFKALSRDQGGNLDGLNVHCAIIDELHAHKTRDIWDVLETATGSRRSPLQWAITTAGFNQAGICYEQRRYVSRLLEGVVSDPEYFGIIYTIDDDDEWTDPTCHRKANPNWGVSVKPKDIDRKFRKAKELASAQNNFLTKHLNCWVNADVAWMNMPMWVACGDESLSMSAVQHGRCYVALDLATRKDIASMAILFDTDDKRYLFFRHYISEWGVKNSTNSQYDGWRREGKLIVTPGNVTDYERIEDDLLALSKQFRINEVAYDPWQGSYLAQRLAKDNRLVLVELRQTVAHMSEPMKQLEAEVMDKTLVHDGCPVATWMMSNVVCHVDKKDNIYPNKESPDNKIDGIVAAIMAMSRYIAHKREPGYTATHGLMVM